MSQLLEKVNSNGFKMSEHQLGILYDFPFLKLEF